MAKQESNKKKGGDDSFEPMMKDMVEFGGELIDTFMVKRISREQLEDEDTGSPSYNIVINKSNNEAIPFCNIRVKYGSEERRDLAYDKLKMMLIMTGNINIHTID